MKLRHYVALVFCLLLSAAGAYAQFETATVLGSVTDSTGGYVPSAAVTLQNIDTGIKATVQTDAEGGYKFLAVRIGKYKVSAEAQGFSVASSGVFEVTINAHQRVNLALQVGSTTESVTVVSAARTVETDSSDRGQVVRTQQIETLPLNGRSYADLALLGTGVRKSLSTTRDASFNVNGQRAALNNFMIDGLDNNAYATSNQGYSNQVVQPSPDALAEFKVQTNNYSAEYGRASGAVVNASIKSGTNELHGALWEFARNTQLNAVGFFRPTSGVKPTLVQNQFGFTGGGPIRRNHTFFFLDYEGFRAISRSVTFAALPTMDQRAGKLGVATSNPFTGATYPGGQIPASDINPYATKIFDGTPTPNIPNSANNYSWMPRTQSFYDKGDVKLDQTFNSKWTGFVRLSQRKVNNYTPPTFPGASSKGGDAHVRILNQHLALATTYVLNAQTVIEARMGISRTDGGKSPDGVGNTGMEELYGVTGIPKDSRYYGGLMTVNLSGYAGFGRQSSNPQFQNPRVYNPKLNFSRMLGAHTLKGGYEYQNIQTKIDDFNPKYGAEDYGSQFTRPSGASSSNIYNISDFLLGLRDWYELSSATVANIRQKMHFFYAQDDWKVAPNLTLNLGLRYEFATPQYERDNHLTNFDPANATVVAAKNGSIYDRALVHPDTNNFAPRLGFAYALDPRTSVRGGFGISYVHFNRLGAENLLVENYPFFLDVKISQDTTKPLCTSGAAIISCFRTQQMGFPDGLASTTNASLAQQGWTYYLPSNLPTGYTQNWHVTIQRELIPNLILDMAYVGSHGVKFVVLGDANQARPNAVGENTTLQLRRPYPTIQNIEESLPAGYNSYHALQMKLERRFSGGFYLLNSFTWSKAMDNAAGHLEANSGDNSRVNIQNLASEKGLSSYNQPFNNTSTVIYDLPYGKARKFGSSAPAILDAVAGGWQLNAINTMTSGQPLTLRYGPTSQFSVSSLPSYRPNVTGDPKVPEADRSPSNYLSKTTVVAPTDPSHPFGSAGRNTVRCDAFYNLDLGLHKQFKMPGEGRRLEFRAEGFNLLNHTNFVVPNSTRTDAAYGTITSAFPARILQFGLKLYY